MNGILLDTHIIVWLLDDDARLSSVALTRVAREKDVFVSAISLWEVAIKVSSGRFSVNIEQMVDSIAKAGFYALPIAFQHAMVLASLPPIHRDPFDRMLVAQSLSESLVLLTADRVLSRYPANIELV